MSRALLFILCLVVPFSSTAVQRFQTPVSESSWYVNSSPVYCELGHDISHYGNGRFVYSSGGELAFQLRSRMASPRDSVVSLYSISPFWRQPGEKELAQLSMGQGYMPVYIGGSLALRMLYELQAGHHPTFHYKDWADYTDDVHVTLSSVNFHSRLDEFEQCMQAALPYGSSGVQDTSVNFAVNKHYLTESQRKKLKEIVLFAKIDKSMKILLRGHTDDQGLRRYNKRLSQKRSRAVERYLISQGVPEDQISTAAYGESRPVDSNRSERGRRNNRRVSVIIRRDS